MIATYVPAQLTPVTRERITKAFLWAMPPTSPAAVALALAQWALETGRGKSMYNFCVGNAKAGPAYKGQYTSRRCNEVLGGKLRWFLPEGECDSSWTLFPDNAKLDDAPLFAVPPGHPQTRFRAYANIYDGTLEHVALLEKRFAKAWPALLAGNALEFVMQLRMSGYFTAALEPYFKAVESLQREFLRVIDDDPDVPESPIDPELERLLAYADSFLFEPIDNDPTPAVV